DSSQRPCRCGICLQVPAPAEADEQGVFDLQPTFLGVYPRGLASIALAELNRAGCRILAHHEAHCAVLFRLPASGCEEAPAEALELGSFLLLCELPGGA
ncbi:unnamed protein product, partial [Polarella glacialis]